MMSSEQAKTAYRNMGTRSRPTVGKTRRKQMTQPQATPSTREERLLAYIEIENHQEQAGSLDAWAKGDILLAELGAPSAQHGGDRRSDAAREQRTGLVNFLRDAESADTYRQAYNYWSVADDFQLHSRELEMPWTTHRIFAQASEVTDPVATLRAFKAERERVDANRAGGVRYTSRDAERFIGRRGTRQIALEDLVPEVRRGLEDMSPEDRVTLVNEVVEADTVVATSAFQTIARTQPEAMEDAIADADTAIVVGGAVQRRAIRRGREMAERGNVVRANDPGVRHEEARTALIELMQEIENIRRSAERISTDLLPHIEHLPDAASDPMGVTPMFRQALIEAYRALEPVRHLAITGETDLDTWLRSVLSPAS